MGNPRACRQKILVGDGLTVGQMQKGRGLSGVNTEETIIEWIGHEITFLRLKDARPTGPMP